MEYKEGQFVNTAKSHKSNQPNMNPTIKTAEKVAEELNQSNKNSGGRRAHNTQKRDWESPKITNGKATHGRVLEVQTASSVVMKTRSYGCQEEI